MLRVAIVIVGDEVLAGHRADANGPWLAGALTRLGATVDRIRAVGDDEDATADVVRRAAASSQLVICCGGIGPTEDDRTREAIARAAGSPLRVDDDAVAAIEACLEKRGVALRKAHRQQAQVPKSGGWLANITGVAPGIDVEIEGARVVAFPGVPHEMHAMFEAHIEPWVRAHADRAPRMECAIWTAGIPESEVEKRLLALPGRDGVRVGFYPHEGEVEVRLVASDADALATFDAQARNVLGANVFDPPVGGTIEHAVLAALRAKGATLATAESVTGGHLANMLTRVPGASDVYLGGWLTYAAEQKTAQLGVPVALLSEVGVVSEPVARAMAMGARRNAGADYALATTGVAGPGDWGEIPQGRVFIGLALPDGDSEVRELNLPFTRRGVQRRASVAALDLLRRALG